MKKLIFILSLLLCLSMHSQEKKWRTITVGNLSGITFNGKFLNTTSVALDYELKNGYSISSWAGVNYNYSYDGGWVSGQVSLVKKVDKYNIGAGLMYGSGNKFTPFPDYVVNKDIAGTISISRRFKL